MKADEAKEIGQELAAALRCIYLMLAKKVVFHQLACQDVGSGAWAIDELDQSVLTLYSRGGIDKFKAIPDIDQRMSERIEKWLINHNSVKEHVKQ